MIDRNTQYLGALPPIATRSGQRWRVVTAWLGASLLDCAEQIIRALMRLYIADSETPNALTADTIRKSRRGEDVFTATSAAS